MYCPKCACGFAGWTGKCPIDGSVLIERPSGERGALPVAMPYETIVDLLGQSGGTREIELCTTEVVRRRKFGFPWRGYGFAWAGKMHGDIDGIAIDLHIDEVGIKQDWGFPYQGYGFAWERKMRGWIGGHEINLTATEVEHEKKLLFPYRGHGYAWTKAFSGECGISIRAEMRTTDVARDKGWYLFYFAFGYAWIQRTTLRLSLKIH